MKDIQGTDPGQLFSYPVPVNPSKPCQHGKRTLGEDEEVRPLHGIIEISVVMCI